MATGEDARRTIHEGDPYLYGSAQWASKADLAARGFGTGGRILLGYRPAEAGEQNGYPVTYGGERHLLTVAPTRSGKGVSAIIPALLDHAGSALVVDPKGENAIVTAEHRAVAGRQNIHLVDPWGKATGVLGLKPSRFNPLDMLDPASPDLVEDALLVADALVMPHGHGDPFWSDEARAMIMGFILHVVVDPQEEGRRTLGRVREILNLGPKDFYSLVAGEFAEEENGAQRLVRPGMAQSGSELVRSAAARILQKSDRELASVVSTAQQNTHFLESPLIRESLSRSDFRFEELGRGDTTVYLVLPVDRLNTFGRWLRLLVSMAITAMARLERKPEIPVLFLLDEFAALGRLEKVEEAYGLMAGFGMQLWAIVQDFSQLKGLYQARWQTFIANAGVIQCFGTRDWETAQYISNLCGVETVEQISEATAQKRQGLFFANPAYRAQEDVVTGRRLIMPDEVMTMHPGTQILVLANSHPAECFKTLYFLDRRYRRDGGDAPVFRVHPAHRQRPLPRPVSFTAKGVNIGRELEAWLMPG